MNGLLEESLAVWHDCPGGSPVFERTFSASEQASREPHLDQFLAGIQAELRSLPRSRSERQAARERITAAFTRFASAGLDLRDEHLQLLLGGGLSDVGTHLARAARRFDTDVGTGDILQANRNAWTACGLQMLLGQRMRLTPAIFAYSMLYPYSDNYLDDSAISREAKAGFSGRFGRRLAGDAVPPANAHEALIWRLVELIEGQYERAGSSRVFESLLAIHRAQADSLRLLRGGAAGADVPALIFGKGGSSVLADGYLAAGTLSDEEARFVFRWGVLLQLADDLQDVHEDRRNGVVTLFSQAAADGPLDELTNRTLHFARSVMDLMSRLPRADCPALKELIRRSCLSLLIRSAGEAGELFTAGYLAELETHSPFRFAFLTERRRRFAQRSGLLDKLFEAFLAGDDDEPAFPLLPSSLMPRA